MNNNTILQLDKVSYTYDHKKYVLKDYSIAFEKGKVYAVVGKSGAGKTTLLSLLAGLDKTTDGRILVNERDISKMNKYRYRSTYVGVIFQSYNLISKYTALENVQLSIDISGKKGFDKRQKAVELLSKVGLNEDEMHRRILRLSGGQQQRVAIARAISFDPDILLADEPTGNLDPATQDSIMRVFLDLAHKENKCIIIVTHSNDVADMADEVHELNGKKIAEHMQNRNSSRPDSPIQHQPYSQPEPQPYTQSEQPKGGVMRGTRGQFMGSDIPLKPDKPYIFGADPSVSNIVLDTSGGIISRKHCSVVYNSNTDNYTVTDYSTNGTFVILKDSSKAIRLNKNTPMNVPAGTIINIVNSSTGFILK